MLLQTLTETNDDSTAVKAAYRKKVTDQINALKFKNDREKREWLDAYVKAINIKLAHTDDTLEKLYNSGLVVWLDDPVIIKQALGYTQVNNKFYGQGKSNVYVHPDHKNLIPTVEKLLNRIGFLIQASAAANAILTDLT